MSKTIELVLKYYDEHGHVPDIDFFLDLKSQEDGSKSFGCHCDLELFEEPDGCCIDAERPEDCIYASGKQLGILDKRHCKYWKEKTGYRVRVTHWNRDAKVIDVLEKTSGWDKRKTNQFLLGKIPVYVEQDKLEEFTDGLSPYCDLEITEL